MAYVFKSQFANAPIAGATTSTVTLTNPIVAGDVVFVLVAKSDPIGERCTGITDNGGNTYVQVGSDIVSATYARIATFVTTAAAGATTVTATYAGVSTGGGFGSPRVETFVCTGLNSAAAQMVGQYQGGPLLGTDVATSTTLTPASQPGQLIGWCESGSAQLPVSGTGFTSRSGNFTGVELWEDIALSSTAAVATTFSFGANSSFNFTVALYAPLTGAAANSSQTILLL